MAFASTSNPSNLAMALAGQTASVDIPKPRAASKWTGKDSFAAVAAKSLGTGISHPAGLPTPPNSISPTLPPQGFQRHADAAPPTPPGHQVESDLDLQDAVDHANAQDQPQRGLALAADHLASLETAGAITPGLLAKHHLPEILLNHGPLAIRHVMGFLTTSVPGFSGIPPTKARRIVVGALEGRGSNAELGGLDNDVVFEKVGWGRWDARRRGQPSKHDRSQRQASPTATRHSASSFRSPSPYGTNTLHIPLRGSKPSRVRKASYNSNLAISHGSRSLSGHLREPETEADRMSLDHSDDDASCASSSAPDEGPALDDDLGEVTDEEDWASIGAAALRAGSFPHRPSSSGYIYGAGRSHLHSTSKHLTREAAAAHLVPTSVPTSGTRAFSHGYKFEANKITAGVTADADFEAVQALMKLGSV